MKLEDKEGGGSHHRPSGLSGLAAALLTWTASGTLGWAYANLLEWLPQQDRLLAARSLKQVALLIALAGVYTVGASALLCGLHLLLRLFDRLLAAGRLATSLLVGAALLFPAMELAEFVTAGDSIAASPWVGELRVGVVLFVVAGGVLLWLWHLVLVGEPGVGCGWCGRSLRGGWRLALWTGGLAGAVLLCYAMVHELSYYAFLAGFLVFPAWLLAATVVYVVLRLHRGAAAVVTAIVLSLLAGSLVKIALEWERSGDAHRRLADRYELAGLTAQVLFRPSEQRFRFDLSRPSRFRCAAGNKSLHSEPVPTPLAKRRNVVIISVDALRSDMVNRVEEGRKLTPSLDDFAARTIHFRKAVTTYPATLFALGSALTGLDASQILFSPSFPPNLFTMTASVFDNSMAVLPESKWFREPVIAPLLIQGTKVFRAGRAQRQTDILIRELKAARQKGRRTLAWVHYFEPHLPYQRHKGFNFGGGRRGSYLSEVAYTDRHLGRLLKYLERDGWLEDSMVVILADHGQALGERGYWGHHVYLNSYMSDIPIFLYAPGLSPGASDELVSIPDITPSVLHFVGLPRPDELAGTSLFLAGEGEPRHVVTEAFPLRSVHLFDLLNEPLMDLEELRERVATVQMRYRKYDPKVAVVQGDYRLIVNRSNAAVNLFSRDDDASDDADLSEGEPEKLAELMELLEQWHLARSEWIYCSMARSRAQ